jgi:dCMP deaminase
VPDASPSLVDRIAELLASAGDRPSWDDYEEATVHAEQNAIADAARRGVSVAGSTAYISHFPCIDCAKILAAAGVQVVKYHFDYGSDLVVLDLLADAGVTIAKY